MLKSLHIENIAVIEQTDIEFFEGFNVLTGETGAGKSIVIDAINAVLGERTSKELIRGGCEDATVTALFCDLSEQARAALEENGFHTDCDGNLLIMRKLTHAGGAIKINGQAATAGILKAIGKSLINIHGQHDNQSLLKPESHYLYLDRLAENRAVLDEYYAEFRRLNSIRKELAGYETDEAFKQHNMELLEYQIKELTDADLKPGETEELKHKIQLAQNAEKIRAALSAVYGYLNGDDLSDGAFSAVRNAQKELASINGENYEAVEQRLVEILSMLDDVTGQVRSLLQDDETAGLDNEALRARLDYIVKISIKYGGSENTAISYLEKAVKDLDDIKLSDKKIVELSAELDESTNRLIAIADRLTATRRKAASQFIKDVTEILLFLDMPDVQFDVSIEKGKYTSHGCDNVEFLIKTNAGEELKPLIKIASGGELSRIMLAIKSVLADKDDVDTLIFDEIDSGISGRAAQKVGHQLKQVSAARQTVCVTHLAQIAAFAQNHLLIEKSVSDNRTYTSVKQLSGEDRVAEIARIMAGSNVSENIYNSARELLERNF